VAAHLVLAEVVEPMESVEVVAPLALAEVVDHLALVEQLELADRLLEQVEVVVLAARLELVV